MDSRVAVIAIIVEESRSVEQLNGLLHQYRQRIIGRMGVPYRQRGIHLIAVALDAPQDVISSLAGKIGSLPGRQVKTAYSGVLTKQ